MFGVFHQAGILVHHFEKKLEEFEKEAEAINQPQVDAMERCAGLLTDMRNNPMSEWCVVARHGPQFARGRTPPARPPALEPRSPKPHLPGSSTPWTTSTSV